MSSAPQLAQVSEDASESIVVRELVNDLRQPMNSIAAIAYYVEMTLPAGQLQAQHYLQRLQDLVDQTNAILNRAGCL